MFMLFPTQFFPKFWYFIKIKFFFMRSLGSFWSKYLRTVRISKFTRQEKETPIIFWLRYLAKQDTT